MVIRLVLPFFAGRIKSEHRQFALERRAAKWTYRSSGIGKHVPFLLAALIETGLDKINRFDQLVLPLICCGSCFWMMEPLDKGAFEQFGQIGSSQGIG